MEAEPAVLAVEHQPIHYKASEPQSQLHLQLAFAAEFVERSAASFSEFAFAWGQCSQHCKDVAAQEQLELAVSVPGKP